MNRKLTICLKDLVDWIIYEQEYTEANIGREINRKMDLTDIYSAFALSKSQPD